MPNTVNWSHSAVLEATVMWACGFQEFLIVMQALVFLQHCECPPCDWPCSASFGEFVLPVVYFIGRQQTALQIAAVRSLVGVLVFWSLVDQAL